MALYCVIEQLIEFEAEAESCDEWTNPKYRLADWWLRCLMFVRPWILRLQYVLQRKGHNIAAAVTLRFTVYNFYYPDSGFRSDAEMNVVRWTYAGRKSYIQSDRRIRGFSIRGLPRPPPKKWEN
jgi:hypothetical protein